jgi:uncharacterized membrane protein YhaH (DUF805 family)
MALLPTISPAGRLGSGAFALAVAAVYVVSFLSQALLSVHVTSRVGLWPFAVLQAALIWTWYVLHVRRLRDAGRTSGAALGIAILYAMMIVLVLLVMAMLTASETSTAPIREGQSLLQLFAVVFFILMLIGNPDSGVAGAWLMAFGLLLLAPIAISLGFSIWAGARPGTAAVP